MSELGPHSRPQEDLTAGTLMTHYLPLMGARYNKTLLQAQSHAVAADQAERLRIRLGVPVIILTIIVGTSSFASLADLGKTQVYLAILTGCISVLAAVLAGLQTFFDYAGRAEAHKKAAAQYEALARKFERVMILILTNPKEASEEFGRLEKELDEIVEKSPRVEIQVQSKVAERLDKDLPQKTSGGGSFKNVVLAPRDY